MAPRVQSIPWKKGGKRAVLLVHGVGNAQVGDYADLVQQVATILGADAADTPIYMLYYDQVNDWFVAKQQANLLFARLVDSLRALLATSQIKATEPAKLGNAIADLVGDVLWPVLLADARNAVRDTVLAQLFGIVDDADAAGTAPRDMHLSIIAHSMGCFHVYETLQSVANDPSLALGPASGGLTLANVIYMASPVQLIRSVIGKIAAFVPQHASIRSLSMPLALPTQASFGKTLALASNTVAITGNLDPVGGHFFRDQEPWAFMNLPGQQTFIDQQQLVSINGSEERSLTTVLHNALRDRSAPVISPNNPHSWSEYVRRHQTDLRGWLLS